LKVWGNVVPSIGKGQELEVQTCPEKVEVIGTYDSDTYPVAKMDLTVEYLRSIPMWRCRTQLFRSVFTLRDLVVRSIHNFFEQKGYIHIHSPLITKSDCEGAGETFQVVAPGCPDFFGTTDQNETVNGFLTVSGQLQGEVLAAALGSIYTFGPTFRAERSSTNRHLSEFLMMEPEIPFATLSDIVNLSIEMLKYVVKYCIDRGQLSLKILDEHSPDLIAKLEKFISNSPVIMTYTEAIEKLKRCGKEFTETPEWGIDLGSEHETWLCGDSLTIITDYPKDIKAFYMYENPDCEKGQQTVACMDILLPGIGEVIGGSQRESRLDILEPKMQRLGLGGPEYDFYRDLRRFGYAGSSGFGLGVERLVRFVTGMKQIRDVIPFPISYGKIYV
jgi:asparaginyl-tRNA synthetase